jgi:hypothetical protein
MSDEDRPGREGAMHDGDRAVPGGPSRDGSDDALARRARALPRALEPPRDLWPGIERRLRPRRPRVPRWLPLAAALALAAGAWLLGRMAARSAPGPAPVATAPDAGPSAPVPVPPASAPLPAPDAALADPARELLAALERDAGTLAPGTVAALRRNLAVIDSALAESRRALAADPGDGDAERWLRLVERQRLDLVRQVVRLPRS